MNRSRRSSGRPSTPICTASSSAALGTRARESPAATPARTSSGSSSTAIRPFCAHPSLMQPCDRRMRSGWVSISRPAKWGFLGAADCGSCLHRTYRRASPCPMPPTRTRSHASPARSAPWLTWSMSLSISRFRTRVRSPPTRPTCSRPRPSSPAKPSPGVPSSPPIDPWPLGSMSRLPWQQCSRCWRLPLPCRFEACQPWPTSTSATRLSIDR